MKSEQEKQSSMLGPTTESIDPIACELKAQK
jgi:hypothetical protein